MKKENIYKFLYIISIFLIIGFIIRLSVDYFKNYEIYSLPFYFYIIERFLEFIVPSIVTFVLAKLIKKKYVK